MQPKLSPAAASPITQAATFRVARRLTWHASRLDDEGRHAHADNVDQMAARLVQRLAANPAANGANVLQDGQLEPQELLEAMRVHANNLLRTVQCQRGHLTPSVQALAEQLVHSIRRWLTQAQADLFSAKRGGPRNQDKTLLLTATSYTPPSPGSSQGSLDGGNGRTTFASTQSTIKASARTLLGALAYLGCEDMFACGPEVLKHIRENLRLLTELVDGRIAPEAVANQVAQNAAAQANSSGSQVPDAGKAEAARWSLGKGSLPLGQVQPPLSQEISPQ